MYASINRLIAGNSTAGVVIVISGADSAKTRYTQKPCPSTPAPMPLAVNYTRQYNHSVEHVTTRWYHGSPSSKPVKRP